MAWPRPANGLGKGTLEALAALLRDSGALLGTVIRCWRE